MIVYTPFWKTLKKSEETTYSLINKHNVNSATINRLRKNESVTVATLNDLCKILHCDITDIIAYIPED